MFHKKIPLHFALLMTVAGIAISSLLLSYRFENKKIVDEEAVADNTIETCKPAIKRLNGYKFIGPLLFTDRPCQSEKLMPIKNQVENLINSYKLSGTVQTVSVYLRQLNLGEWISIGDTENYFPGSLLKVPELICYFKMNERSPGLLDKKFMYSTAFNLPKKAYYISKSIEVGKAYTIRELLYYMIAYSDNNATMLLNQHMDLEVFKKVFSDLGLLKPNMNASDIPINVKDYSYFMRVLYNASYLDKGDSEFCTELLTHCDFVDGLVNGLPKDIKVAHKFGEAGDSINAHFSESGIVYIHNSPYLLTVMTKGKDKTKLPPVISDISRKIFEMINVI